MADSAKVHIVIDFGSNLIKCGYSCETLPRFEIPNVVGKVKKNSLFVLRDSDNYYCGYDALYAGTSLEISYPRLENNGIIDTSEEGLKNIRNLLKYIIEDKMKSSNQTNNVLIVDSLFTTAKERSAMADILFNDLKIYQIHFEPQSLMTLYSTSKTSGLVVESGEITTEIVPIIENYVITDGISTFPIAGREITRRLEIEYKNSLQLNNVDNHYWMSQRIKEKFSRVFESTEEYEKFIESNLWMAQSFKLPDGNSLSVGKEVFEFPEAIFNPSLININCKNLPLTVLDSINKCDISARKELYNNIIVGGGNSLISGFSSRLRWDINDYSGKEDGCNIIDMRERKYSAWTGASGLCSLSSFSDNWISKEDYLENGEKIFEDNYLFNYGYIPGRIKRKKLDKTKEGDDSGMDILEKIA